MFWRKSKFVADVIEERCRNCGDCVGVCRHGALVTAEIQGETRTFVDDPGRCTGCGKCARVCPGRAIEMVERYC
ncbi:MAG: 4Fe-4S binding protein [Odoribacteraceae bacterium]|nr:4Fe-4S binding protein [Odoribacteraceae bacterium]